jgi:hypothetical protein
MDLDVCSILEATYILNEGRHSTVLSKEQVMHFVGLVSSINSCTSHLKSWPV